MNQAKAIDLFNKGSRPKNSTQMKIVKDFIYKQNKTGQVFGQTIKTCKKVGRRMVDLTSEVSDILNEFEIKHQVFLSEEPTSHHIQVSTILENRW